MPYWPEHRKGERYHALLARTKDEDLLSGPPDVKILQPVGRVSGSDVREEDSKASWRLSIVVGHSQRIWPGDLLEAMTQKSF
ncbi:hypothetical protein CLCR_03223 [Cladophialophora carrionii]|uniref:Uncharacterized protein n=1 Tax=Cladophialophora carrionii TaxID=86049 RepID=A0A1C1D2F0_9EURO|nr:hypothetical protein CLCR_03223 [Cladophialophora carrionii]